MRRLILLNGPPGVGKSTLATRYAAAHPGTLCCDIDVLRTMVGGSDADFVATGALVRPAALALITAYLRDSGDVVLPQLIAREVELARFERAAAEAGADFVHVLLDADPAVVGRRLDARPAHAPHLDAVRLAVQDAGGTTRVVAEYAAALRAIRTARPDVIVVDAAGALDATFAAVVAAVGANTREARNDRR